jgi:exopolysaccharide biosynthesis predicted pyruvyltransferase EpsI
MNVRQFLEQWRSCTVYFPEVLLPNGRRAGNHGDYLIEQGTRAAFRDVGIQLTDNPRHAELLVIAGGGNMVQGFKTGPETLREFTNTYPLKPVVVLPSSFFFPAVDFGKLFGDGSAPVTLFCRDRVSHRHLIEQHRLPGRCQVLLDHDMAFQLADDPLIARVRAGVPRYDLIVERWDSEHPSHRLKMSGMAGLKSRLNACFPDALRPALRPLIARIRNRRKTRFRSICERMLSVEYGASPGLPRFIHDISLPDYGTFEDFTRRVSEARSVMSTRLHVAILAAMAGKQTVLFEGGYWKARGVYDLSLTSMPNVRFIDLNDIDWNISP